MALKEGTRLGPYEILCAIGAGGMGEVYRARDTRLGRIVAIKVLPVRFSSDPERRQRFQREARVISRLNHPNICTLFDVGQQDDIDFLVVEYVEGETLASRSARKPFNARESLDVAAQVADALAEAHLQGIIHRDIKLQNLMITPRGQVKVMDFGLAKLTQQGPLGESDIETSAQVTEAGALVGTLPYFSPEQVEGEAIDGRSDIFSFGAVMYSIIAGRQPFAAESKRAMIAAILGRDVQPLSRHAANVPAELERIVRKCLEKERERRYQSAQDLLVDLRNLQRTIDSQHFKPKALFFQGRRNLILAALAAVILSLLGAGLYLGAWRDNAKNRPIYSLAVLPFVNSSNDSTTEYLSDGITESLINTLSQLPNLKVIARASVFRYKGREIDAQAVGRDLKVQTVLTGRVVQMGESLSISAELMDAKDSSHIWGAQYQWKLSDIFALQEEISMEISQKLRPTLTGTQTKLLAKRYTHNVEAYQLYMKGRFYLNKRTPEGPTKAIEHFEQAIQTDPGYALAYAGLADSYSLLGSGSYDARPPREIMPKAKDAAMKALALDDSLAEAHTSLALVKMQYEWDWSSAESELKRALELNTNYTPALYWHTFYLSVMGRLDEAVAVSRRAQVLDPLSLSINTNVARAFYYARKYDLAIEQCQKAIELDKNFVTAYVILGLSYEQKGMYEKAIPAFRTLITLAEGAPWSIAALGHAYAASGKRDEAMKIISDLKEQSKQRYVSPFHAAAIYNGLGDKDRAFEWFEKAYEDRSDLLVYIKMEPEFDNLRQDARFASLLRRVGLAP